MKKNADKPFKEWTFAQKRDEWMRRLAAVPEKEMPSGAKLVAFRLSLYMQDAKRRAHPSYAVLGTHCGMSAKMVMLHTLKLQDAKWLDVQRRRNKGNAYWLRYPWTDDDLDLVKMDKCTGVPLETEA